MVTKSRDYHRSNFTKFVLYPLGVVFFLFVLTIVIILANGYRFNLKDGKLVIDKTGIVILSARPNDTDVYLMNKYTGKKTSFSFLTTRINDLLPGKYLIALKKDGFRTWQKNAEVKANLVTWLNYAILFPNDLKTNKVDELKATTIIAQSKNKKTFLVSKKDANGLTLYTSDQGVNLNKIWPKNYTPLEEWLKQPDIITASFNSNNDKILLKVKNGDKTDYAILEVATDGHITSLSGLKYNFTKFAWNPSDSNDLFGLADGTLYRINVTTLVTTELGKNIVDFSAERNGQIYFVTENEDKTNSLNQMSFDGSRKTIVAKALTKDSAYKISYSPQLDALAVLPLEEKTLTAYYRLNNQLSTIDLAKNVKDFSWGQNGRKIFYYGDNFIKRFDWDKQEEIEAKIDGIKKVEWYFDDFHYLVQTDKSLFVTDFDGENKVEFSNKADSFFLDPRLSSIIFLENLEGQLNYIKYSANF